MVTTKRDNADKVQPHISFIYPLCFPRAFYTVCFYITSFTFSIEHQDIGKQ